MVTEIVMQLVISALVMKAGQAMHVIYQTVLVHLTALDVDFAMLHWTFLDVKTVLKALWDQLVVILARMVYRYQWIAVTVCVSMATVV